MAVSGVSWAFLSVLLVFAVPLVIVVGFIILASKLINSGSPREGKTVMRDEAKLMQEIYNKLSRMEKRIDSLETILMDRIKEYDD